MKKTNFLDQLWRTCTKGSPFDLSPQETNTLWWHDERRGSEVPLSANITNISQP